MRYTKEQVDNTSKLIVEALYSRITIDEAMELMFSKEVKIYKNFKLNVINLKKQLDGKVIHFVTSCNWAEAIYKELNNEDKSKFIEAMKRQVKYDLKYNVKNYKLRKWIDSNTNK
jgi:hypothetical protein